MVSKSFSLLLLFFLAFMLINAVDARDTNNPVPRSDIRMTEYFYPDNVVSHIYHSNINPNWINNNTFWYSDNDKETTLFYLVDSSQGTKKLLFNTDSLASALAEITKNPINTARLPISSPKLSNDMNSFEFAAFGKYWDYNISTHRLTDLNIPGDIQNGVQSPDNHYIAYVNGSNLWLYDITAGKRTELTTDGTDDYFYGKRSDTVSYPVSEKLSNETPEAYLSWSADSSKIMTFRVDQRNVSDLWVLQNSPGLGARPVPYSYRYANPGDEYVPLYEPVSIDLMTKRVTKMDYKPQTEISLMDTDQDVLQWWDKSGEKSYSTFYERGEMTIRLLSNDPKSGKVTELLNETGDSYIESNLEYASKPNVAILEKTGDIVWFSERDGWGQLYLYSSDGELKNRITDGPWVVRELLGVDEDKDRIFFTASGKEPGNPYYQYLYSAGLNGSNLTLLTPDKGDHEVMLSPDMSYFTDAYSRIDLPTETRLCTIDGSVKTTLARADDSELVKKGWTPPEQFTFKARDKKTDLYGLVFKPTDFNEKKSYPVIDVVYPGPYTIVSATGFPSDLSWNSKIFWTCQMISELGYVVVTMDGLGTAYRSKSFHNVSYGHLSDCGLPDHIIGLKDLASENKYINLSRVGMYGKSAGGFMTAQAMLTYPEFFKVGVAASGDQDCRLYGSFWGEKYEGYPVGDYYNEQVTALKAGNLSGNLMLMTGDMDDNVNPSMTMQLANALEMEGKQFDMFIFSNKNHDLNYDPYYLRKMMAYFVKHL